ncbi:response regulator, partial [bacterium]|nr:response regulator [bacterium]
MLARKKQQNPDEKIRVLVVDDSAMIRRLLTTILDRSPFIEVVDSACDANDARSKIKHYNPDVVTLDIEMPGMDGLTFLERIMRLRPTPVIMCSTLTQKGAESTLKALSLGAVDFVAKPTNDVAAQLEGYADEFVAKIRVAAKVKFDHAHANSLTADPMKAVKQRTHPKV